MIYKRYIKRLIDILFSLIALPFILILIIPFAIAIKLEDGGSIFYNSLRVGKNQKKFKMFKLRSMKEKAPDIRNSDGSTFSSESDPRVTKVGRIIRKTSIDELPQFINVLLGDMSLIGPRPAPEVDKSKYPEEYYYRFKVVPGITGYNQAMLRNASTKEERIKNNKYYIDNISFLFDIRIFFMTIKSVIFRKNINKEK